LINKSDCLDVTVGSLSTNDLTNNNINNSASNQNELSDNSNAELSENIENQQYMKNEKIDEL